MGQSQAYKRRHPGRQGQISAQEYTGLTFRWITAVRIEGRRQQGQAAGSKVSQDRPGHTAARARTASTGTVRQGRPGTEHRAGSRETQQARHTRHAQQAEPHSTQGKRGSRGTRRARGQATGSTGTEGCPLKHETH